MEQASIIGLGIAVRVFPAHGVDASGRVVFRKRLVWGRLLALVSAQPPCTVALEACGSAHRWGSEIGKLGHTVGDFVGFCCKHLYPSRFETKLISFLNNL